MNCKPGDLAIIVGPFQISEHEIFRGQVVRCESFVEPFGAWVVSPELIDPKDGKPFPGVRDCALRPIRDPGDDAVDEMVQKLGPALPVTYEDLQHG